jgi:hypothetical protein
MLEGALAGVMQELGAEITELIDMAVPALDALIQRVSHPSSTCRIGCQPSPIFTADMRSPQHCQVRLFKDEKAAELGVIAICCDLGEFMVDTDFERTFSTYSIGK